MAGTTGIAGDIGIPILRPVLNGTSGQFAGQMQPTLNGIMVELRVISQLLAIVAWGNAQGENLDNLRADAWQDLASSGNP